MNEESTAANAAAHSANHQIRLIYSTPPSVEVAREIGRQLVDEDFARCVNILPNMHSIYRWDGKIASDDEAVLIIKTTHEKVELALARLAELHPYDCPCGIVLPIETGLPAYLAWLAGPVESA